MTEHSPRFTNTSRARWLVLLVLVTLIVDQVSKAYAVAHWKNLPALNFLGGMFQIKYAENQGAFLSLLADVRPEVRFYILTVANGLMLVGLVVYLLRPGQLAWSTFLPLALLVAGGLGNLIDRARFQFVIDFMYIEVGVLHTGVFNVADMAITAAFLLLVRLVCCKETCSENDAPSQLAIPRRGELEPAPPAGVKGPCP